MKRITILMLLTITTAVCLAAERLQIYQPREITVSTGSPVLGDVAVIRGDESLAAKASAIPLGQFSTAGQKITLDKNVIKASLASNGIKIWQVEFSGAESVTMSQKHLAVSGKDFAEKALAYLTANPPHASVCRYTLVQTPQDLILADVNENVTLSASITSNINNQVRVLVSVLCGQREVGSREVAFTMRYNCKKAVAATDIPAGTILSTDNVRIENFTANMPQAADWTPPYGMAAKRLLAANSDISMSMLEAVKPPVILKRDQNVLIKVERLGMVVTALGTAMQDGRVGDLIKVRNLSSQRVIAAKVKEDGSVEPVF